MTTFRCFASTCLPKLGRCKHSHAAQDDLEQIIGILEAADDGKIRTRVIWTSGTKQAFL